MQTVFTLKVELADIEPVIWRRIVVPSSLTLTELHAVIQGAVGWEDSHLHLFEIAGQRYEIPEEGVPASNSECLDERRYKLEDLLTEGMEFSYVYDFGDDWTHIVTVEDQGGDQTGEQVPACIDGERACPPEDCGGPFGYPEFLDALCDPDHPEHEHWVEWANGFEPEPFNVAEANNLIQALCALYRERG